MSELPSSKLNDFFDDVFNKLTIDHNLKETSYRH
jgi:hypothetical protein